MSGHGPRRPLSERDVGFSMAGDQTTGLAHIAGVVGEIGQIRMGETTSGREQHGLRSGHVPVLGSTATRERHIEVSLAAQNRGHLEANAAHSFGPADLRAIRACSKRSSRWLRLATRIRSASLGSVAH